MQVSLQVHPMRIGSNQFEVTLRSNGHPIASADKVQMTFTMLDMEMEQTVLDLKDAGNGACTAQSEALSVGGRGRIDMLLRLPGQYDQRTSFDISLKE
ncbi:MAG: FixH family protein [Chloroflexota bacterium]|nr:FixH family protein [Chloroflexota bacterium]